MADLLAGVHGSVAELAASYGTDVRYVARHLPLACLSPAIIDAILDGRQPIELTTWDLLNRIEIPLDWDDQARRLGCC
jgi:site-specific DNA recombinase